MALSQPPPELAQAIQQAAKRYAPVAGLSPAELASTLTGIWRIESKSSFPNPYANGLGYGGEFGTAVTAPFGPASEVQRITEPPVQQQANLSASILAAQLRKNQGDMSKALFAYSGGGYSSVPGGAGDAAAGSYGPHGLSAAQVKQILGDYMSGKLSKSQAEQQLGGPVTSHEFGSLGDIPGAITAAASTAGHYLLKGILYAALLGLAVVLAIFGLMQLTGVNRQQLAEGLRAAA